jgi:hypothetical protein
MLNHADANPQFNEMKMPRQEMGCAGGALRSSLNQRPKFEYFKRRCRYYGHGQRGQEFIWQLADGHLFCLLRALASNATLTGRGSWSSGLALEDLPELEALIGGYEELAS